MVIMHFIVNETNKTYIARSTSNPTTLKNKVIQTSKKETSSNAKTNLQNYRESVLSTQLFTSNKVVLAKEFFFFLSSSYQVTFKCKHWYEARYR